MSDELINRLRNHFWQDIPELCDRAADRIEALELKYETRKELELNDVHWFLARTLELEAALRNILVAANNLPINLRTLSGCPGERNPEDMLKIITDYVNASNIARRALEGKQ